MIKQIAVAFLLLAFVSCTEEKNLVPNEEVTQTKVYELPKNAVDIHTVLKQYKIAIEKNAKQKTLFSNQLKSPTLISSDDDTPTPIGHSGYQKFFIVYPINWTLQDRFNFLSNYTNRLNISLGQIIIAANSCQHVDTWYISNTVVFEKNKSKNLIVATDPSTGEEEDEEDGPKTDPLEYTTCDEVPIPLTFLE
ncbi:hypothetical protein [Tenacibaculum amylolyticum]|uniref:hypothetical protein n=1 Tax=Tenacibaculum amylolyticum TaxID=104269 RepID=UPI0038B60C21